MERTLLQRLKTEHRLKLEETIENQQVKDFIFNDLAISLHSSNIIKSLLNGAILLLPK